MADVVGWVPARAKFRGLILAVLLGPVFVYSGPSGVLAASPEAAVPTTNSTAGAAQTGSAKAGGGILDLDIEQLAATPVVVPSMDISVTSVAKEESTVGHSPAAIYVITKEMIARSACNNIPDLLRMAPGVEVARIDAHTWAITIRGDNDRYTNKVLVLVDGRSVYSTVVGNVYWDTLNMMLQDIERIEITRGPNGTLWGANAVNGMINIITKKAKDTQGAMVTYGGGSEDRALGGIRVGGAAAGGDLHYRIYGKQCEEAPGYNPTGPEFDDWRQGRGGFRADWEPGRDKANEFTLQGDYYQGTEGFGATVPVPEPLPVYGYAKPVVGDEAVEGNNILARWTHTIDEDSDWMIQTYFDQDRRSNPFWTQNVNNFDVEFQHRFPMGQRHSITWGAEHRQTHDVEASDEFVIDFDPLQRTTQIMDFFIQDQITLVEERLFLTLGTKLGRNSYTGFEYQPSGRVIYIPDAKRSLWAAISRAVGTSRRFDQNGSFTGPGVDSGMGFEAFPRRYGNPELGSEHLMAYEVGYRAAPVKRFSYDIALYYYQYENLRSTEMGTPFFDAWGNRIYPIIYVDGPLSDSAYAYGGEVGGEWMMSERWRLRGSYGHIDTTYNARKSPTNQVKCGSSWDLGDHWQFDATLRYVDFLSAGDIPPYVTMDCRLAWLPRKNLELAVIGRNLLDPSHYEFSKTEYPYYLTEVRRSVFGCVTWMY